MSVTIVAGVTGVGLTSVCQAVRGTLDDSYTLLNFGDVMLEQAATSGITTDRAELATLSQTQTRRLQRRAGEFVADEATQTNVLLSSLLRLPRRQSAVVAAKAILWMSTAREKSPLNSS